MKLSLKTLTKKVKKMDEKIDEHLKEIDDLVSRCEKDFIHFDGIMKLKRKLDAEKKFLISLKSCQKKVQEASLNCLNLIHLKAVVREISVAQNVTAIFKNFKDKKNNLLWRINTTSQVHHFFILLLASAGF